MGVGRPNWDRSFCEHGIVSPGVGGVGLEDKLVSELVWGGAGGVRGGGRGLSNCSASLGPMVAKNVFI